MSMRFSIVLRDPSDRIDAVRRDVERWLTAAGGAIDKQALPIDEVRPGDLTGDMVLVLGGDGTILRTCRVLGDSQRPILGLNLGRLGFLADVSPDEFREHIPDLVAGNYRVASHLMFECSIDDGSGKTESHLGLNEAAILAGAALQMIAIELTIDGERVTTICGDGVILSTPVGSTAYSLAAGGPILRQDLDAFVVTTVSPHTLSHRPLVDRADSVYTFRTGGNCPGATLVIDGQIKRPLNSGDVVSVRKAGVSFQKIRLKQHSYYATLHRKLGWGGRPTYRGETP